MRIVIEKKRGILGILLLVFMLNFVFAASILDELHLNIQTTDGSGNVVTGTFDFDFNISTTSDCNSVIYSDSATLTTDARGIISYYLTGANLDYSNQYYLCHYRDNVLINNSKISRTPYAFRAKYVNVSGIQVDSNLDLSGFNLSADYVFGDGSLLTNLNVSEMDLSNYVPYTGANQNLILGANNFSVGGTDLFVDNVNGRVGIGTANPDYTLDVNGNVRVGNIMYLSGSSPRFAFMDSEDKDWQVMVNINDLSFWGNNGNTRYMTIQDGGNVGIGTSTPSTKLQVNGSIIAGSDSSISIGDNSRIRAIETSDDYLYLESNGNGATRVNYMYGSGGFEVYNGTGSNLIFDVSGIGNVTAQTDVCLESGECLSSTLSGAGNVNSSNYWDGLDTISDISGSQINNDLNWINASEGVIVLGNWSADKNDYYTKLETYNKSEVDNILISGTVNDSEYLDGYDSSFFMPLNTSVVGDFDFNGGWTGGGLSIVGGDVYAQTGYFYKINSLEVTNLEVNGSLIPDLDNSFDIGNSSLGWRDGYFSGAVTADSFVGDGSGLTNLNVSAINLSSYVPYTGATGNLVLGNNNFSVGGSDLFVNNVNGKVGIGTDSPSANLHILDNTGQIIEDEELDIETEKIWSYRNFDFTGNEAYLTTRGLRILNYADINSNDAGESEATVEGLNVAAGGNLGTIGSTAHRGLSISAMGTADNNYGLFVSVSGATKNYAIYSSGGINYFMGDVGIGTITPQNKLDVVGNINATGYIYGDGSQLTNLNVSAINLSSYVPYTGATGNLVLGNNNFSVGGSDFFVDSNGGKVGVGTDVPSESLEVNGNIQITGNDGVSDATLKLWTKAGDGWYLGADSVGEDYNFYIGKQIGEDNANFVIKHFSGRVGIGTTIPSQKLEVNGTAKVTGSMLIGETNITTELNGDVNVW